MANSATVRTPTPTHRDNVKGLFRLSPGLYPPTRPQRVTVHPALKYTLITIVLAAAVVGAYRLGQWAGAAIMLWLLAG